MKNTFVILISCGILTGCMNAPDEKITVQFPVTEECKESSINKLRQLYGGVKGFEFAYKPFNYRLDSHPEISGYIELSSSLGISENDMEGDFNAVLFDCYPTTVTKISVSEFSTVVPLMKIDTGYAKISNGEVQIVHDARKR